MSADYFAEVSHQRYNPLTNSWILVSPHRAKRPWLGQVEKIILAQLPAYDPQCYLCPGNKRISNDANPGYKGAYVFTNDFSAFMQDIKEVAVDEPLFKIKTEKGISRVIIYSPEHNVTIPQMSVGAITEVVELWINEYKTLGAMEYINHVQIFENKGEVMGCSNPHPHGQIWAQQNIPTEPYKKQVNQLRYYLQHGTTLLNDYLQEEKKKGERIIFENESFICLVPFWAVWPFETMIISKRAIANITQLNDKEKIALAVSYKTIAAIYDKLFQTSFPYSAGIHQAPTDKQEHPEWHLHMVFYPPLLRSATIKKFMVGYEMLANPQRDITPEWAAQQLRSLVEDHIINKI